jgi:hypothetical protein
MNDSPTTVVEVLSLETHRSFVGSANPWSEEFKAYFPDPAERYANTAQTAKELTVATPVREQDPIGQYDTRLKVDSRTGSAAKLKYVGDIVAESDKAICFRVCDYTNGGWYDEWFPKSICSNLDPIEQTFWVWIKFLEDTKPDLIPKGYRM